MPRNVRPRVAPTEDWQQLRLLLDWPEQLAYELIRPVVLFGRSVAERAKETGAAAQTIYRKAKVASASPVGTRQGGVVQSGENSAVAAEGPP